MLGNKYSNKTKHLVSIGGGVSSTLELPLHVIDKYGADNTDFVICALRGESPDLWRMVDWLEQRTGKHVYRVAWQPVAQHIHYGLKAKYWIDAPTWGYRDIWDVFNRVGIMGNSRLDPCSRVLKRETMRDFVRNHYNTERLVMHVGITHDEIDRMLNIRRNWAKLGVDVRAELADTPRQGTSAERAERILGWVPFVYSWGASHNNCGGFCVKAGHQHMARLLYYDPDTFAYHEAQEARFRALHNTDAAIMRDVKVRGGVRHTKPLPLSEFRERMRIKWSGLLPGMTPFDDLDTTPACSFCDAIA